MSVRDRVLQAYSNAIAAEGGEVEIIALIEEADFLELHREMSANPGFAAGERLARWELERSGTGTGFRVTGLHVVPGAGVRLTPSGIACVLIVERGALLHVAPWPPVAP